MPYKVPNIPIFPNLQGTEKRVQELQQRIAELDWLEYSFGLCKRVTIERNEEIEQAPVVYIGINKDVLDMRPWPDDIYKAYAFWDLIDASEFLYGDNVTNHRRYPKVQQPVALIVCLDNEKISNGQDHNITHSICRNELLTKLNNFSLPPGGIFQIASVTENNPEDVFDGFDVEDKLNEPYSMMRIEGLLTYLIDCS